MQTTDRHASERLQPVPLGQSLEHGLSTLIRWLLAGTLIVAGLTILAIFCLFLLRIINGVSPLHPLLGLIACALCALINAKLFSLASHVLVV